jgi:hypothetical protein
VHQQVPKKLSALQEPWTSKARSCNAFSNSQVIYLLTYEASLQPISSRCCTHYFECQSMARILPLIDETFVKQSTADFKGHYQTLTRRFVRVLDRKIYSLSCIQSGLKGRSETEYFDTSFCRDNICKVSQTILSSDLLIGR